MEFDPDIDAGDTVKEIDVWTSCLAVTEQLLLTTTYRSRSEAIMSLHTQIIAPAARHTSPEVRLLGIKCLGLLVFHDFKLAKTFVPFFVTIINNDLEAIRLHTIRILVDLLMLFGPAGLGDSRVR